MGAPPGFYSAGALFQGAIHLPFSLSARVAFPGLQNTRFTATAGVMLAEVLRPI